MGKRERQRQRKIKKKTDVSGSRKRSSQGKRGGGVAKRKDRPSGAGGAGGRAGGPGDRRQVRYTKAQRILVLGDGDFSFSHGLVAHRKGGARLVATSFDAGPRVLAKYPTAQRHIEAITGSGARAIHSVDATRITATLGEGVPPLFDRILFNFPHTGEQRVHLNRVLLATFFTSAAQHLSPGGQVHLAMFTGRPYSDWHPVLQAAGAGFVLQATLGWNPKAFPGYRHVTTLPGAKQPDVTRCHTYVFELGCPLSASHDPHATPSLPSSTPPPTPTQPAVTHSPQPLTEGELEAKRQEARAKAERKAAKAQRKKERREARQADEIRQRELASSSSSSSSSSPPSTASSSSSPSSPPSSPSILPPWRVGAWAVCIQPDVPVVVCVPSPFALTLSHAALPIETAHSADKVVSLSVAQGPGSSHVQPKFVVTSLSCNTRSRPLGLELPRGRSLALTAQDGCVHVTGYVRAL